MSLEGFDPKFKDFPDYIIGITKEIWEDRNIASLHHYYAPNMTLRSPAAILTGNHAVIANTMATLAEFPDRQLLGEDVIWSGAPEEGMLSSHRLLSTATHRGDGIYGPATGKQLIYRIIADCHAINNQINDEWLVRDQGAIVRQLGWSPKDYARDVIEKDACPEPYTPANDRQGPYLGRGNDNEWGERHADILRRIMAADLAVIPANYDRACQLELPGGVTGHSHGDADHFWMGLRSSFPSALFSIDHQIGRTDDHMPDRAAVRWSLHGKHDGFGMFGAPTGAEVYVMGISHAEFGPWGLRREWTLIDETAIWMQILLHTG